VVLDGIGGIDPLIKSMNEGIQANEFKGETDVARTS
jgi:hypothetical protein